MCSTRSRGAAAIISAAAACSTVVAGYQVGLSTPIDHAFVSVREWNGGVSSRDLVPISLGSPGVGTSVFGLGNHDSTSWAVFATCAGSGMSEGINGLINLPTGLPSSNDFTGFDESTMNSCTLTLYNGALDTSAGCAASKLVRTNEDVLPTDGALAIIDMYSFSGAKSIATVGFGVPAPGPMAIGAVALMLVWTRRRGH